MKTICRILAGLYVGAAVLSFAALLPSLGHAAKSYDPDIMSALVPHRALYAISMVEKHSGAQIVNVSGEMMYKWEADCMGWSSNHRVDLNYEYAEIPAVRVTNDYTTYETRDGESLNFSSQKHGNGEPLEKIRGHATLAADPHAYFSIPEGLDYELPDDTLFPMLHTVRVMENIKAGKKFYSARVFDGSDTEGPIEINAFIGAAIDTKTLERYDDNINADLLRAPARKVRLAFYPAGSAQESVPEYEMDIVLHQNGVISDMIVEYDNFTVAQKLIALEPTDMTCSESVKAAQ